MDTKIKKCRKCTALNSSSATRCYACGAAFDSIVGIEQNQSKLQSSYKSSLNSDSLCDLVDVITNGTVRITCVSGDGRGMSLGTGFFIKEKGKTYLVTNYHVIQRVMEKGGAITVRFPDNLNPRKDNYLAFPIGADPLNDVALLEVAFDIPSGVKPLELALMSSLRRGQQVVAVGNPHGMEFNCINGIIANTNYQQDDVQMSRILCSLNAAPGNSGGPVVRVSDGKVIGIATQIFVPDYMQSHTICASADAIRQMIFINDKKGG